MLFSWLIGKRWRPLLVLFATFQRNRLHPSTFWQAGDSSHSFSCSARCRVKIHIPYFDLFTLVIVIEQKIGTPADLIVKAIGLIQLKFIFCTMSLKLYRLCEYTKAFRRQAQCFEDSKTLYIFFCKYLCEQYAFCKQHGHRWNLICAVHRPPPP